VTLVGKGRGGVPRNHLIEIMDKQKPSIEDFKPGADALRSPTVNVSEIDIPAFLEIRSLLAGRLSHVSVRDDFQPGNPFIPTLRVLREQWR